MRERESLTPTNSTIRSRRVNKAFLSTRGNIGRALIVVLPLLIIVRLGAAAEELSQVEKAKLASEVKTLFKNKCAKCHGPEGVRETKKPKGELDYILDFPRLTTNPSIIVRGDPDESKLYNMVADLLMPDESAGEDPLPDEEIQLIGRWIKAGAPTETGTAAAMKFHCPATKKFDFKTTFSEEQLRRRKLSTRLEELPNGIFLERCAASDSDGKVTCNRHKVDRVETNEKLHTRKFYAFDSQVNFQLFSNLTSVTDDGVGGVVYGKCRFVSP